MYNFYEAFFGFAGEYVCNIIHLERRSDLECKNKPDIWEVHFPLFFLRKVDFMTLSMTLTLKEPWLVSCHDMTI